jgi:hypothetical protein
VELLPDETIGSLSARTAAGCDRKTSLEEDRPEIKVTFDYLVIVTFEYSNLVLSRDVKP